eukprot:1062379-Amphidinium_carterae.1
MLYWPVSPLTWHSQWLLNKSGICNDAGGMKEHKSTAPVYAPVSFIALVFTLLRANGNIRKSLNCV